MEDDFIISRGRPRYDIGVAWTYEIDLDRNIFHVDGIPFFHLGCLPSDDIFIEYVSEECRNHYDNFDCAPELPPCHKYKRPAPPAVADSDLATCQSSVCVGTHVALSNLLAVNEILSPIEHVRVSLLEMMIGQFMRHELITRMFYQFELATDHTQLTDEDWSIAYSMVDLAFAPQIFDIESRFTYHQQLKRTEFTWVREDTVLCIATYLDDKRCLQASVSRLINAILEEKDSPGDYFGVIFSVQHCAVVKVVKDEHTATFSHTDALQFLPSFYGYSPSTPGIVALSRLAYRIDPALFVRASAVSHWQEPQIYKLPWITDNEKSLAQEPDDAPPSVSCPVLPLELWQDIALHLHVRDLLTFGLVSRVCREAASVVLRYPHVCGFRLVATKEKPRCSIFPYQYLVAARFSAVRAGIPANVSIGSRGTERIELTFNETHIPIYFKELSFGECSYCIVGHDFEL
jgi:hypothetical protein